MFAEGFLADQGYTKEDEGRGWILTTKQLTDLLNKFRDLKFTDETKSKLHANYVARLAQDVAYGTLDEFCHNLGHAIRWYNESQKQQIKS